MPVIKAACGNISYTTYPLYLGVKKIDKNIARENLLLFKDIVSKQHITFGLIAGTLLGAIREHDFIEHDEDVDLFLFEEDKQHFFSILHLLTNVGFRIARYDRRGLLSIMRKGEYIDLYFFAIFERDIRICSGWCVPERFLKETVLMSFLGSDFMIPKDFISFLEYQYGKEWKKPVPYTDFKISVWKKKFFIMKEKIKDILPDWIYFYLVRRNEKKLIKYYRQRIDHFLD